LRAMNRGNNSGKGGNVKKGKSSPSVQRGSKNQGPKAQPVHEAISEDSSSSILDRYKSIGARYVRRTETSDFTILLEVGKFKAGKIEFIDIYQAEAELYRVSSDGAHNEHQTPKGSLPKATSEEKGKNVPFATVVAQKGLALKDNQVTVPKVIPKEAKLPPAQSNSKGAPRASEPVLDWANEMPDAPGASVPMKSSKKITKEVISSAPDLNKRSVRRFGLNLEELMLRAAPLGEEVLKSALQVLDLSQNAFNALAKKEGSNLYTDICQNLKIDSDEEGQTQEEILGSQAQVELSSAQAEMPDSSEN